MKKMTLICIFFGAMTIANVAGADSGSESGFEIAAGFISAGEYADAVNAYQLLSKTARNERDRAQALLLKGAVLGFSMSSPLAAMECYRKILVLYPESSAAADALFHSAVMYYGQGRFDLARDAFSEYLNTHPCGARRVSADDWLKHVEAKDNESSIRMLVADRMNRLDIRSEKNLIVQDTATGRRVFGDTSAIRVTTENGELSVNGHTTTCRQLRVWSDADVTTCNDRRLRGAYILSIADSGIQVVNQLPVEQYLYGIIPEEMPYTWPGEALMAQAVASRTYALYVREQNRHAPYDVSVSETSQVYGGVDAEKASTTVAVNATLGQVMTFDGDLVAAYFHADSGGHTEDVRHVWDVDFPYLKGAPDRYSENETENDWECYLPFSRIGSVLRQAGATVGTVCGINILEKSPTGRVLKIEVVSNAGGVEMTGNRFRVNLGSTMIKSTRFQVAPKADGVLLTGRGYGHGVGMSQLGAGRMALTGFSYKQILEFYYPGTVISDAALVCRNP